MSQSFASYPYLSTHSVRSVFVGAGLICVRLRIVARVEPLRNREESLRGYRVPGFREELNPGYRGGQLLNLTPMGAAPTNSGVCDPFMR